MLPPLFFLLGLTAAAREPLVYYIDWFPSPQFAGVYLALDKGFYTDAGLDLTVKPFAFGQKPAALMDAQPEQASVGTVEGYIFLERRAAGQDLHAFTAVLRESPAGYITRTDSGIKGPRDFPGRKIGIHKYGDPLYKWFLAKAGVVESSAPFQFVDDDVTRLTSGQLDVMQGYAIEELVKVRRTLGRPNVRFLPFKDLGFDAYSQVVYATGPQLKAHDKAIRAFIAATRRGWIYALAHPPEAVDAVSARLAAPTDRALLADMLGALGKYVYPEAETPLSRMSEAKWRGMQQAGVEMGLLPAVEPTANFLVESKP